MEPYNNRRDPQPSEPGSLFAGWSPALLPGLILVGIGALFLLGNLQIVHVSNWMAYWPVILVAVGLAKLVDSNHTGGLIAGAVLMALGGLFLADSLGYLAFRVEDLWPLILIGIGLTMLWNRAHPGALAWWGRPFRHERLWTHRMFEDDGPFSGGTLHEAAIFGGSRRVVSDQDFKGGRISCVFGGTYLDLTGAAMVGDTAVLSISTIYGGATVRLPANWNLEMRAASIFGGFADRTVHPPAGPGVKRLVVRGAAIFGGVTFKN